MSKEAGRGSPGKHCRAGWGWRAKERVGRGLLTGMLPLGAGLGPEGSPGAQLVYRRGSCSTHWKSLCEAWRPIQRSKVTLGRLAVMNATAPAEERVMSERAAPSSLCSSPLGGRCQRTTGPPHGLALPCSKGFAMVTSWASCCSQENCASDHFTRSWGSWPWIRKHCGGRGRHGILLHPPAPHTQKLRCGPLGRRPWLGRLGGCERKTREPGHLGLLDQGSGTLSTGHSGFTYTCPHSGEFLSGKISRGHQMLYHL